MAESGFAAPSGESATTTAPQENAATPAPPATLETYIAGLTQQVTDGLQTISGLSNSLIPANRRTEIIRDEIIKVVENQYGADAARLFRDNNGWMRERLHEKYRNEIRSAIDEATIALLDESVDGFITAAARKINRNNAEDAFSTTKKFVTFVDCLIRELFPYTGSSNNAPTEITFELCNGGDNMAASGVKLAMTWRSSEYRNQSGIVRGSNMVVNHFPWIGREALVMPEGDDNAAKEIVKGHRRLYAKAVLVNLANAFPR